MGTARSTWCRLIVSAASRVNTVISTGSDRRSWVMMLCNIASSPMFHPPYDPEIPTLYILFAIFSPNLKPAASRLNKDIYLYDTTGESNSRLRTASGLQTLVYPKIPAGSEYSACTDLQHWLVNYILLLTDPKGV
jgi:hypothetical protein